MKQSLQENKLLVALFAILLFVLLGAAYYYIIYPKMDEEKSLERSISSLEAEQVRLQSDINRQQNEPIAEMDEFLLRKKLPVDRDLNALIRSLEEVELITGAEITAVQFNNYDALVSSSNIVPTEEKEENEVVEQEDEPTSEEALKEEANVADDEEEVVPETQIDITTLPNALKLLTLNVNVNVKDYDDVLVILNEIESLERVIRIDSVNFSQQGEEQLMLQNPDETISVSIQLTTFYSEEEAS